MILRDIIFFILMATTVLLLTATMVKYFLYRYRSARPEDLVEDPQALEEAQAAVNQIDLRRERSQSHVLLDNFSTMQGYHADYMDQLIEHLLKVGVEAYYHFLEAAPTGAITLGRTGTYELYVLRGHEQVAREAIHKFRQI